MLRIHIIVLSLMGVFYATASHAYAADVSKSDLEATAIEIFREMSAETVECPGAILEDEYKIKLYCKVRRAGFRGFLVAGYVLFQKTLDGGWVATLLNFSERSEPLGFVKSIFVRVQ